MMNRYNLNKRMKSTFLLALAAFSLVSSLVMDREANAILQASAFGAEQLEASANYAVPVAYRAAVATLTGKGLPADTCLLLYGLSLLGIAGTATALYYLDVNKKARSTRVQKAG